MTLKKIMNITDQYDNQFEQDPPTEEEWNKALRAITINRRKYSDADFTPNEVKMPDEYGKSKYDLGFNIDEARDLNESRARVQTNADKLANGIIKGAGTAASTFATTFTSLPYGIFSALVNEDTSKVFNNPISIQIDKFQKGMEDVFPNYYTREERNAPALSFKNVFSMNFLADKLIKNAGFTVGAIGSGMAVSKGFQILGKLAMSGRYLEELNAVKNLASASMANGVEEAAAVTDALNKVGQGIKTVNAITKAGSIITSAGTEATFESLGTQQSTLSILTKDIDNMYKSGEIKNNKELTAEFMKDNPELFPYSNVGTEDNPEYTRTVTPEGKKALYKYLKNSTSYENLMEKAEAYANHAGVVDYLENLAILSTSDLIQFGKLLSGKRAVRKTLLNDIKKEGGKYIPKTLSKGEKLTSRIINTVKLPGTEAWEEGSQQFSQSSSEDFYARRFDNNGKSTIDDMIKSAQYGFEQTFETKNGRESMLLGALTGLISGGATGELRDAIKEIDTKESNTKKVTDIANKITEDLYKKRKEGKPLSKEEQSFLKDKNKEKIESATRAQSLIKDQEKAAKEDDDVAFGNYSHDLFKDFVLSRLKMDKYETMIDEIKDFKDIPEDQFREFFNIDPKDKTTKEEFIDDMLDKADKLKTLKDNIDLRFPMYDDAYKEQLFDYSSNIENSNSRMQKINKSLPLEVSAVLSRYIKSKNDLFYKYIPIDNTKKTKAQLAAEQTEEFKNKAKKEKEEKAKKKAEDIIAYNKNLKELNESIHKNDAEFASKGESLIKTVKDYIALNDRKQEFVNLYRIGIDNPDGLREKAKQAVKKKRAQDIKVQQDKIDNAKTAKEKKDIINDIEDKEVKKIVEKKNRKSIQNQERAERIDNTKNKRDQPGEPVTDKSVLEGLGVTQEKTSNGTIEDKRNDIERRRQKELNRGKKQVENSTKIIEDIYEKKYHKDLSKATQKDIFTLVDAINKLEKNLRHGALPIRDKNFSKRAKNEILANGYEIVEMLGKSYDDGMKVGADFVGADPEHSNMKDTTDKNKIITRIIKPQVNFKGKMIRRAEIEVTQGMKDESIDYYKNKAKEDNSVTKEEINAKYDAEIAALATENTLESKSAKEEVKTNETINTIAAEVNNDEEKQEKIEEEIDATQEGIEELNSDVLSVEGNDVEYGYGMVKRGYDLVAYLSRLYKKIINGGKVSKKDIDNELNEQYIKILNPNKFGKGTKVTVRVIDDDSIIIDSDTKETWGEFKKDLSETSDEYTDNIPIEIVDENENRIGFLHQDSWINEDNVFKDINDKKNKLRKIRHHIVNKGEYSTTIKSKKTGVLFRNIDGAVTVAEAIKDPKAIYAIGGNGELISDKSLDGLQIMNIDYISPGTTYVVVQIGTNEKGKMYSALPLKNNRLIDHKDAQDIINGIENAIRIWYHSNTTSKLQKQKGIPNDRDEREDAVYMEMGKGENGYDLSSLQGLSDYINQFVQIFYTAGKPIVSEAKNRFKNPADKVLLAIDRSQIQYMDKNGKSGFIHIGTTNQESFEIALDIIKNSILPKLYSNIDKKSIKNSNNPLRIIKSEENGIQMNNLYSNYMDYLKESTSTDILSHVVDKDENGEDVYGYTVQPMITLDFDEIVKENPPIDTDKGIKTSEPVIDTNIPNELFEDLDAMPLVNLDMDHNTGEEIVKDEVEFLPELEDETIQEFSDKVKDIIIQDLDVHKQNALINLLFKNILVKILNSEETINIDPIFEQVFTQIKDNYNTVLTNIEKTKRNLDKATTNGLTDYINKFKKEINQLESISKTFESYLENKERFISLTKQKLIGENLIERGENVDNELLNPIEKTNEKVYNQSSYQENRDEKMSSNVKKFLSNIREYNDDGTISKDILNQEGLMNYSEVYNQLQVLTRNVVPDYKTIREVLEGYKSTFPFLNDVLNKLDDDNILEIESIRKELTVLLTNHYSNSQFIIYGIDRNGKTYVRIQNANANSVQESVLEGWNNTFLRSDLVAIDENGKQTISKEKADELITQVKNWKINPPKNATPEVRNWLKQFGIILSDNTWKDLENGKFIYGRNKTNTWNELFTKGIFTILANQYLKPNKGRIIDAILPIRESVVKNLAIIEAKYSTNYHSTSHREGVKTVYSYGTNKLLTDNIRDLQILNKVTEKDGTIVYTNRYLTDKLSTIFEHSSLWLNDMVLKDDEGNIRYASNGEVIVNMDSPYYNNIDFFTISLEAIKQAKSPSRENRELGKLTPAEIEFTKLCHLIANRTDKLGNNDRIIGLIYPTTADKSTVTGITTKAVDIDFDFATGNITDKTLDMLYDTVVLPEIERILKFEQLDENANIEESYREGGKKFLILSELNNPKYGLFNEDGSLNSNIQTSEFKAIIKGVINDYINQLVEEKLDVWTHNKIINKDGTNNKIDSQFYNSFNKVADINRSKGIATDMVIQYLVGNTNIFQTFIGDPAMFAKLDKNSEVDVNKTFINISKRLAADIAPGEQGDDTMHNKYKQVCCNDRFAPSKVIGAIRKKIGSKADAYEKIDSTDAQEYVTLLEDLYVGNMQGKIKMKGLYQKVYDIITKELSKKIPNTEYIPQLRAGLTKEEFKYLKEFTLQPKKPVYSKTIADKKLGISRRVYIKSSSFALSPFLTSNTELDKLRVAMETKGISRLAYNSAIKVGNVANPATIWNEDGTFNEDVEFDETNTLLLSRSGFRIQQEVPYNKLEESINKVSQASKNLFTNILTVKGFIVPWLNNGEKVTGKELEQAYLELYNNIFEIQKQDLLDDLEFNEKTGEININKLKDLLEEEAIKRDYPLSDIHSFDLDEELGLLPFSASSIKYESLLNSIVTNRVIKMKFPGKSYVLGSDAGFSKVKSQEDIDINDYDIVWTSKYNGKELQTNDGSGKADQVIMPWDFKADIEDYIVDGMLDMSKIPEELLSRFGMRIPNQGFSSQSKIEVAGFFRGNVGDLLIAPKEFVVRMGSDFDIDHLYVYKYGYHINKWNGKIARDDINEEKAGELYDKRVDPDVDRLLAAMLGDEYTETINLDRKRFIRKMVKSTLINKILDTHLAVHSNSNQRVQRQILEPLDFWKLDTIADDIEELQLKQDRLFTGMSDEYQKKMFIDGAVGKALVAVFSNSSMLNSLLQGKNVRLRKFDMRFGNHISNGDLSNLYTLETQAKLKKRIGNKDIEEINPYDYLSPEEIVYKSAVNSGYQSAAVDHMKEQILNRINVNSDTASIVVLLNQLGFSEEVPYFLMQPIILDYLNEVNQLKNSDDFVANIEELAFQNILEYPKYKFDRNKYSEQQYNMLGSYGLTVKKMVDMIKGETVNDYVATQVAILEKYMDLKIKARVLTKVSGLLSIDSQGIGKSLIEANIKEESMSELSKSFENINNLFGNNTIPGIAISKGLVLNNTLWNKFFPYRTAILKNNFDILEMIYDKGDVGKSTRAAFRSKMWTEIKKYLFSNPELFSTDKSMKYTPEYIDEERLRLFTQSKDNDCLAKRVENVQKLYPNNMFLKGLKTVIRKDGQPNTVTFQTVKQKGIEETIYRDMAMLLTHNRPIGEKDDTVKLFQDLIWGAYLTGGVQEANQYIKFIPPAYLHVIPFAEKIVNIMDNIHNNPKFAILYREDDSIIINDGIKQIVQHNPMGLPKLNLTFKNNKIYGEEGNNYLYGSVYTDKEDGSNPFKLYELIGEENGKPIYTEIPVLATMGRNKISQYNYLRSGYSKSVFGTKNEKEKIYNAPKNTTATKNTSRKLRPKVNSVEYNTNKLEFYDTAKHKLTGKQSIQNALRSIKNTSDSPFNRRIAQLLFDNIDNLNLENFGIRLTPNLTNTAGNSVRGKVETTVDGKTLLFINTSENSSNSDRGTLEHTILHEFLHVITRDVIRHPKTNTQRKLVRDLDNIRLETKKLIQSDPKLSKEYQKFLDNGSKIVNDIDVLFYSLNKTTEFASVMFSNETAQKTGNELMSNNKSILDKIRDKFIELLNTLGFNITKGSITEAALNNIMNIITTQAETKTFEVTNEKTSSKGKDYNYKDFAKDNKGRRVTIQYPKYKSSFEAIITGDTRVAVSSIEGDYIDILVKTNTGKILSVNPYTDIKNGAINIDKLSDNANFISSGKEKTKSEKDRTNSNIIEDLLPETTTFLPLKGNEEIYDNYGLLNKYGKIKQVAYGTQRTKDWLRKLNRSPYYTFTLRKTSDGKHRILISDNNVTMSDMYHVDERETHYQNNTKQSKNDYVASEKTIRDLAARIADRIGLEVKYISDRTQNFKGKLENDVATINLAYATLDTPIHEILGHPIVKNIKNTNQTLYKNLLEELSATKKGREVFDRVKKNYKHKEVLTYLPEVIEKKLTPALEEKYKKLGYVYTGKNNKLGNPIYKLDSGYTLEEQQEEAIVELLGLYTADRLDKIKDSKLISLLKELLKKMKSFIRKLFNQKEIEISKLPDNMTLGNLADLLAYSNSKLILPGHEVIYTTPDNQTFKTYQEANNHISKLTKLDEVNLSKIKTKKEGIPVNSFKVQLGDEGGLLEEIFYKKEKNTWYKITIDYLDYGKTEKIKKEITLEDAEKAYVRGGITGTGVEIFAPNQNSLDSFISKNKGYEQSKEIIEKWKKVNNIEYDPEEVYSRGQGFYSISGAYSDFDVDLMFQNLLSHIEDNKKSGGEFVISATTDISDHSKSNNYLVKENYGKNIYYKIFPQNHNEIKWATHTDCSSGSVIDAANKINHKYKNKELTGVSYTKSPRIEELNKVEPSLASMIENTQTSRRHFNYNELGIELTGNNFRLEYDDDVPYSTKRLCNNINSILDQKFGKIVKPKITNTNPKQSIQTKENLKESIESIKDDIYDDKKEYTSQAKINTKIAALKNGYRKFPRSLIRSEVKRLESYKTDEDIPVFQRVTKETESHFNIPEFAPSGKSVLKKFNEIDKNNKSKLLRSNTERREANLKIMTKRANIISSSQPYYNAVVKEVLDEKNKTNGKKFYKIFLEGKPELNDIMYLADIIPEKYMEEMKKQCK